MNIQKMELKVNMNSHFCICPYLSDKYVCQSFCRLVN